MKSKEKGPKRLRVKSIDCVERTGKGEYHVEATMVEDDRPRRGGGRHKVEGHFAHENGRRKWVPEHEARDPRR